MEGQKEVYHAMALLSIVVILDNDMPLLVPYGCVPYARIRRAIIREIDVRPSLLL